MAQPFAEKCAAIISLCELIYAHLDSVPGAMHVQRYDDAMQGGGTVDVPATICRRWTCWGTWPMYRLIVQLPPKMTEEKWNREYLDLRRRYRIADVEASLTRLSSVEPMQAQAVWAVHVEPWLDPATEPIAPDHKETRRLLAEQGIEWMAHDIRGDVLAFGDRPEPVDNQIRQLASQGYTYKRIKRELRCGGDRISRVLRERALDALGV